MEAVMGVHVIDIAVARGTSGKYHLRHVIEQGQGWLPASIFNSTSQKHDEIVLSCLFKQVTESKVDCHFSITS